MLKARNDALEQLSSTSVEMRSTLKSSKTADISAILARRQNDCNNVAKVNNNGAGNTAIIDLARKVASNTGDELGKLAGIILSMHEEAQVLSKNILSCQSECESILKERLEATGNALRQSTRRRKLDSAYGPAIRHDVPVFLDKQR